MFDENLDTGHKNRLLQIKLRDNKYLPNIININSKPHKKLSKSKSQLINLSSQIEYNRRHLNSVNRALHKKRPVDYYDEGKYIYDREIEKVQKLLMDRLKNKNDKLEKEYNSLKQKMIKIPLYKLKQKKKKKKILKISSKSIHKEQNNIEDNDNNEENKEEQNEKENEQENQEEENNEENEEEDNKNNDYLEKQQQSERRYSKYSKNNDRNYDKYEKYENYSKNNNKRNNYKKKYRKNYDDEDDDDEY